jgi:hypothetical protein
MSDPHDTSSPLSSAGIAAKAFWITLGLLISGTLALILLASLSRGPGTGQGTHRVVASGASAIQAPELQIPASTIQILIREAAEAAEAHTHAELAAHVEGLFAPVYAAIPAYADFHYSVIGEYTELYAAARQMTNRLQHQLFAGFDERLSVMVQSLDTRYVTAYEAELAALVEKAVPPAAAEFPLSAASQAALDDALSRASMSKPISAVAATGTGVVGAKVAAASISAGLVKIMGKTAAKTATKGTGIAAGAGLGAAVGSFLGPVGAAVGGVFGAGAAWFAVDHAVVKVDEFFNRDAFEAELRALVDAERAALHALMADAIALRTGEIAGQTIRDLHLQAGEQ